MNSFSIIIATHNAAKGLAKTLDSILGQSFAEYEVLVIDSQSADDTLEILKGYQPKFSGKLKIVSEPDNGIYDAMNKGIGLAKGDWLYFCGSGDYLLDAEVLADVANVATKVPVDVIYGDVQWGETTIRCHGKFSGAKLIEQTICHQAIFVRPEVFKKTGLFDTKYKISADYVFNMQWFNDKSIKNRYLDRVVAVYDVTGLSSNAKDLDFESERESLTKKYFSGSAIIGSRVRVATRRAKMALGYLLRGDLKGLKEKKDKVLKK